MNIEESTFEKKLCWQWLQKNDLSNSSWKKSKTNCRGQSREKEILCFNV